MLDYQEYSVLGVDKSHQISKNKVGTGRDIPLASNIRRICSHIQLLSHGVSKLSIHLLDIQDICLQLLHLLGLLTKQFKCGLMLRR